MKAKKPPAPLEPPPVSESGADRAQAGTAQKKKELNRLDFDSTILRGKKYQNGVKSTLG